MSGIVSDLAKRFLQGPSYDVDSVSLVLIINLDVIKYVEAANQRSTTTWHNAFLNCGTGCVKGVFNPCLLLLHFGLSGCANVNYGNSTDELCKALLELFPVVVRGGLLDLGTDLFYAALYLLLGASTVNYCGGVLVNNHAFGSTKVVEAYIFQLDAKVLGYHGAASEDGNVFQHCLSPVTKARSLDCASL